MKLILVILLISCSKPKYALDSQVIYKVPDFYKNVCTGYGRIITYSNTLTGNIIYTIQPPYDERIQGFEREPCPDFLDIEEENVRIKYNSIRKDVPYDQ